MMGPERALLIIGLLCMMKRCAAWSKNIPCEVGQVRRGRECVDLDECEDSDIVSICGQHALCVNTEGSYTCRCYEGFKIWQREDTFNFWTGHFCEDINECINHKEICGPRAYCTNMIGTYRCTCETGYEDSPTRNNCTDIDECLDKETCGPGGHCTNTIGSYNCTCLPGYIHTTSDGCRSDGCTTCADVNECEDSDIVSICGPHALCVNTEGSFTCRCYDGFKNVAHQDNFTAWTGQCEDINECMNYKQICGPRAYCTNAIGTYRCTTCETGYDLTPTRDRCTVATTTPTTPRSTTLGEDGPKNVLLAVDPPGDVVKGSSVTLTCSSSGSNPPVQSYILFKDNTVVAQKNIMTISNVQPSDSGTYYCEAWNDIAGVNSPPVTVDVHYPPEKPSVSVSPPGGVVVGRTVTLSCSSDANPPVSRYTWYKDRQTIFNGPQLEKINVSLADSGEYICLVKNKHGSQRSSLSLEVRPPMRPNHCGPPEVYHMNSIVIGAMRSTYAPGAKVFYDCMVGYNSTRGTHYVRCTGGKWTPLTLTCEGQCGRRTVQTGIAFTVLGGTLSRPGQHPWQVSLQRRRKGTSNAFGHHCGGVLIASCWVLTAAHCIDSAMDMQVVLGGVDIRSREESDQTVAVERDFIHRDYWNTTGSNDIALLQLSVTDGAFCAKETNHVKTACLPNKLFSDGKPCVISGWGTTKDADRPHKMSHGDVSIMSKDRCREVYGALRVDNTMLCAEDKMETVNFCNGDSGGPLICKDDRVHYVAGLMSWVNATCSGQEPGVYADVHRHVEWIAGCVAHNGSPCVTQSVSDYDYLN